MSLAGRGPGPLVPAAGVAARGRPSPRPARRVGDWPGALVGDWSEIDRLLLTPPADEAVIQQRARVWDALVNPLNSHHPPQRGRVVRN